MQNLTTEENTILGEILHENLTTLMTEINRTDSMQFKDELRQRRRALEQIMQKMGHSAVPLVDGVPLQTSAGPQPTIEPVAESDLARTLNG